MRRPSVLLATSGVLLAILAVLPPLVEACGPFPRSALFVRWPGFPPEEFLGGRIGIVDSGLQHLQLYAAYRMLEGKSFDEDQKTALVAAWAGSAYPVTGEPSRAWYKEWETASSRERTIAEKRPPGRYGRYSYLYYAICSDSTFRTAAETLAARVERFGSGSDEVAAWLAAQDDVLSNCTSDNGDPVLPAAPEAGLDPLIAADRRYQTAAALFYSGQFDSAEDAFLRIAQDGESPWRSWGTYLAGRAMIRKATISAPYGETDKASLDRAARRFEAVLADPALHARHEAARRMLNFIRLRSQPAEIFAELTAALEAPGEPEGFHRALVDFDYLVDRHPSTGWMTEYRRSDEMTDWIYALRSGRGGPISPADRWRSFRSAPWLVAALALTPPADPAMTELLAAAEEVGDDSPAYVSIRFHAAKAYAATDRVERAQRIYDELLARPGSVVSRSDRNRVLAERARSAGSLEEYLSLAVRFPVGQEYARTDYFDAETAATQPGLLDTDAAELMNHRLPLALLSGVAGMEELPQLLRTEIAKTALVRAIVLGRHSTGIDMARRIAVQEPSLAPLLDPYLEATDEVMKKGAALYLLLKAPGLSLWIPAGFPREEGVMERNVFRENWWCATSAHTAPTAQPGFVSSEMAATAARELEALNQDSAGKLYLLRETVAWVRSNPGSPRAAEMLHLAVEAGRYGCGYGGAGELSQAAFQLLHRNYPNSEWAKKTPYWYDE